MIQTRPAAEISAANDPPEPLAWGRVPTDPCDAEGCDGHYILRHNKQTRTPFLGCSRYPRCRQTAPLRGAYADTPRPDTDDVAALRARVRQLEEECNRLRASAQRRGLELLQLRRRLTRKGA